MRHATKHLHGILSIIIDKDLMYVHVSRHIYLDPTQYRYMQYMYK